MRIKLTTRNIHLIGSGLIALAGCDAALGADTVLEEVTVTGTREAEVKGETPASIVGIDGREIRDVHPGHPSEIMNRMPGVHVNVTGGEGHMTAIRQPITTSPVYLYLEDGIPVRSTGFFNHNALYEINLPQADGIEVLKGPGTALYGSDAIGGVVNAMTRPAPLQAEADVNMEAGEHGWQRTLLTGGNSRGADGIRTDVNLTHSGGWRDDTDYDRQTATLRWDRFLDSGATLKTVLGYSNIDQQTAGSSRVSRDDFENDPTTNYTPISYREVEALRLSTDYQYEGDDSLLSITPYVRRNDMELLPNWSLSYDPVKYSTRNDSIGMLLKYRRDVPAYRTRIIVGSDFDYSPGEHYEQSLDVTRVGKIYTDYSVDQTIYDYDATFSAVSPYIHAETSPVDRLRLSAGLRYDHMRYDYDNKLGVVTTGPHRRPGDDEVDFDHLSPKLGATWQFSETLSGFISYRHAFRVPSESQLFRQGQAEDTIGLDPVKVDSYETGVRGQAGGVRYEVSVYHMTKDDDIVSFQDTDGTRETQNAGETRHRGVELGLETPLVADLSLAVSYSYAKHTFEDWSPRPGINYSGNEMSSAPREIGNVRLAYQPAALRGGKLELEWERLGSYWEDDENEHKYEGHDLFNLRANYPLSKQFDLYLRATNLTDQNYATSAAYNAFRGEELAPGLPRSFYAGLSYAFH